MLLVKHLLSLLEEKTFYKLSLVSFLIIFFALSMADSQGIQKGGKKPESFTYDEALEMLKARDAQWEGKLAKADSLIESQKVVISDGKKLIAELISEGSFPSLKKFKLD